MPLGHNHAQPLYVPGLAALGRFRALPAAAEPEQSQRQDAVDRRRRLLRIHCDQRPSALPACQQGARICRTKAVFEIHGAAQRFDLPVAEGAQQHVLQLPEIARANRRTRRRRPLVAVCQQVQHLRPRLSKAPHLQPQGILPDIEAGHRADNIPLLRPQLQHAAAMLRRQGIARLPHIEEHAAIFQHRGTGMLRQERLKLARERIRAQICNNGRHLSPSVCDETRIARNALSGG